MNITTIIPPKRVLCQDVIRSDVLSCLRRQPCVPLSVEILADSLAGVTQSQVERALLEIEGPIAGADGKDSAYVHRCRCSNDAVFIP
ncbi:MAG: hypothetical protein M1539_03295 [Actinobacteria bacterium]|nr:hypothetical protein [Actinomycetota bacterium]MCL5882983.1 hypothetical protein [Actinomycetota bacterium]